MSHITIHRLRARRRELEREIRRELARPAPHLGRVAKLKRGKLAVKDELFRLEAHLQGRPARRPEGSRPFLLDGGRAGLVVFTPCGDGKNASGLGAPSRRLVGSADTPPL